MGGASGPLRFAPGWAVKCYFRSTLRVGVRELRQNLSVYLRRIEAGESFQVTDRGRPVAILGPLPGRQGIIERMIADGDITPATRDPSTLGVPEPSPVPLKMSLSEALELLRADER